MRYLVLACDYDGTVALDGQMSRATAEALKRMRETGRRVLLVTGRQLPDLLALLSEPELFDRIVAENGAVLYRPASHEEIALAEPPPEAFVAELSRRRVEPLSVGRSIVATCEPHETVVLDVIRELGLEHQVIFNKGSVMVLPSGVNKATGLDAALRELGLSAHNCVAVGDAENDHAFVRRAECAVAVANALPSLKEVADLVTTGEAGHGVRELVELLATTDLSEVAARLARHHVPLGVRDDGRPLDWPPYGKNLLIAGASGSGKSTFTTGLLERLAERGYQYCIIDPEGDYVSLPGAVVLGDTGHAPTVSEMLDVLKSPEQNVVMNLLGIRLADRPEFFATALARLQEVRVRVGRPHQIVADEAHHLMPAPRGGTPFAIPPSIGGMVLITVHPEMIVEPMLAAVDAVVAVGADPGPVVRQVAQAIGRPMPALPAAELEPGDVLLWAPADAAAVQLVHGIPSHTERRRHVRKYAEGDLGAHRSFFFRGPDDKLNLRAQNLALFLQVGDGVDDATWLHHLRAGHYSQWFREAIKDVELADEVADIEQRPDASAADTRARVRAAVAKRYTV